MPTETVINLENTMEDEMAQCDSSNVRFVFDSKDSSDSLVDRRFGEIPR